MVKQGIVLGSALVSVLAMGSAFAAEEGFFLGVGAGQSTMKAESDNNLGPKVKLDESDNAYKFYGGLNFTKWFGIEGGYIELGNQNQTRVFRSSSRANPDRVEAESRPTAGRALACCTCRSVTSTCSPKSVALRRTSMSRRRCIFPDRCRLPVTSTTARAKATA